MFLPLKYEEFVDFESKIGKGDTSQIRWHQNCYATFVSKHNLNSSTEKSVLHVPETSMSTTRSHTELPDLKTNCFFCEYKKHNNDTKLILILYESMLENLKKTCEERNDNDLKRTIGEDFSKLPALDAKYHGRCYKACMRPSAKPSEKILSVHDICFELLIQDIESLLLSGRALPLASLLSVYKELLKNEEYEQYDSYTVQKLKAHLQNFYGSKISFAKGETKSYLYTTVKYRSPMQSMLQLCINS